MCVAQASLPAGLETEKRPPCRPRLPPISELQTPIFELRFPISEPRTGTEACRYVQKSKPNNKRSRR